MADVEVTDEMVERAAEAYFRFFETENQEIHPQQIHKDAMRLSLEAALSQ